MILFPSSGQALNSLQRAWSLTRGGMLIGQFSPFIWKIK